MFCQANSFLKDFFFPCPVSFNVPVGHSSRFNYSQIWLISYFSEQFSGVGHGKWIARVTKFVKKRIFILIYLPVLSEVFAIIQHTVETWFFETVNNSNQCNCTHFSHSPGFSLEVPLALILSLGRQRVVKNILVKLPVSSEKPQAKIPKILPRYSLSWMLIRDLRRSFPPFGWINRLFSCLWFSSRDVCIVFPVIYSIVLQSNTSPRLVSFVFHFISYSILVHGL